jgi:protocatechuate 3,4-dioxygenase alpha subunit
MSLRMSSSQTVGPYFQIGLSWSYERDIAGNAAGERIEIYGRVLDGVGEPIPDAVLEIWQADAQGRYPSAAADSDTTSAGWLGFGRVPTDDYGAYAFRTIKPGRVPGADGLLQAPHLALHVFMRGLLKPVHTRLYFPNDPAHAEDPVLALVPEARRATLIARPQPDARLEWNVHLQGPLETVFFQY